MGCLGLALICFGMIIGLALDKDIMIGCPLIMKIVVGAIFIFLGAWCLSDTKK